MVTLGERSVVVPAVVHLADDGRLVSGDAAERRAVTHPGVTAREVKRRLADPVPIVLGGVPYPATALLAAQLRDVVQRVADAEGGPPERIVLTRPAHWGPHHRELFDQVASAAGLDAPQTLTEPEAAAHHALSGRLRDGEVVAVHDLGGGTFDAAVVRRRGAGFEILGRPEGIERLGGVDFDAAILTYVDERTGGVLAGLDPADAPTAAALARLHQDCVLAKEALSLDTETVIAVFLPGRQFEVRLTRSAFAEIVHPAVDATIAALHRTVRSAGLTPADLHSVLLVGGSSRIPLVAELVSRELGRPVADHAHPMYAVALGAASIAASTTASTRASTRPSTGAPAVPARPMPRSRTAGPPVLAEVRAVPPRDRQGAGTDGVAVATVEPAGADAPASPSAGAGPTEGSRRPAGFAGAAGSGVRPASPIRPEEGPGSLDAPTEVLELPRPSPSPGPGPGPVPGSRPRSRIGLVVLAAAVAVVVLALVFVLSPGRAADTPPAPGPVPASAPITAPARSGQ
jgi:actin-like ATPase involved in cell morphogenesis